MGLAEIKERPILFSSAMVQAILAGRKTQTRRVIKSQPNEEWHPDVGSYAPTCVDRHGEEYPGAEVYGASDEYEGRICPYGQPGDKLWVREAWCIQPQSSVSNRDYVFYRADMGNTHLDGKWRTSIHMPRWASRINLEITNVRVERVQDISGSDAVAEGIEVLDKRCGDVTRIGLYRQLWDSINAKRGFGWDKNPWTWVIEFKRL